VSKYLTISGRLFVQNKIRSLRGPEIDVAIFVILTDFVTFDRFYVLIEKVVCNWRSDVRT